jgi:hypothetical protein
MVIKQFIDFDETYDILSPKVIDNIPNTATNNPTLS